MTSQINPSVPADGAPVVKAELRTNFQTAANEITDLQNNKISSNADVDFGNYNVDNMNIESFTESEKPASAASNVLTIDLAEGTNFTHTLNANITSFNIINMPAVMTNKIRSFTLQFVQNGTGGFLVTWPASFKWPNNGADKPVVSNQPFDADVYSFTSYDAGATWYGFVGGQKFG